MTLQTADPTIQVQAQPPEEPEPEPVMSCVGCFNEFLTTQQITDLLGKLSPSIETIEDLCTILEGLPPEIQMQQLQILAGVLGSPLFPNLLLQN